MLLYVAIGIVIMAILAREIFKPSRELPILTEAEVEKNSHPLSQVRRLHGGE